MRILPPLEFMYRAKSLLEAGSNVQIALWGDPTELMEPGFDNNCLVGPTARSTSDISPSKPSNSPRSRPPGMFKLSVAPSTGLPPVTPNNLDAPRNLDGSSRSKGRFKPKRPSGPSWAIPMFAKFGEPLARSAGRPRPIAASNPPRRPNESSLSAYFIRYQNTE